MLSTYIYAYTRTVPSFIRRTRLRVSNKIIRIRRGQVASIFNESLHFSPINAHHIPMISSSPFKPILLYILFPFELENMTVVEYADEFKVKVPPKRLFKALITDGHDNLPKIVPHIVKSTNVHEGEGGTTGCVRKLSFSEGAPLSHMKDKFEVVDTENLVVKIAVVEDAKLGEKCESIKCEKRFVDSGDGGCIVKWKTQQHQKPGRTHVSEEEIKSMHELMVSILIAAETYLVAHPEVSAY